MKNLIILMTLITSTSLWAQTPIASLRVTKHLRLLEVLDKNNEVIKTYPVMIGRSLFPGPKVQEGDNKTPEGKYLLDWKNPKSKYYKSIHVSYPNAEDKKRAKKLGVSPGGDIMLHGFPNSFDLIQDYIDAIGLGEAPEDAITAALPYVNWTNGCIAVTNAEMEELFNEIKIPTTIEILP